MRPENINVVLIDNPFGMKGSTTKNKDGTYTVIINAGLNYEQQMETYKHELSHIIKEDFDKYDVNSIERGNHGKTTE